MPGKPRPAQDTVGSCAGQPAGEVTTYCRIVDKHEHLWSGTLICFQQRLYFCLFCLASLADLVHMRMSGLRYVWRIEGMSWLLAALKKRAQCVAAAEQPFLVGDTSFECVPWVHLQYSCDRDVVSFVEMLHRGVSSPRWGDWR